MAIPFEELARDVVVLVAARLGLRSSSSSWGVVWQQAIEKKNIVFKFDNYLMNGDL